MFIFAVIFSLVYSFTARQDNSFERALERSLANQGALSDMVHHLGFTGFIHAFKNYVLRGDDADYHRAVQNIQAVEDHFKDFELRAAEPELAYHLANMRATIEQYKISLETARQLHAQGMDVISIDAAVKVDDALVTKALGYVLENNRLHIASLTDEALHYQARNRQLLYLALTLVALTGAGFSLLLWLLLGQRARHLMAAENLTTTRALIDALPNPMLLVSQSGELVRVNRKAEELFGQDRDELVGRQLEEFMPEAFRGHHAYYRDKYFESGGARSMMNHVPLLLESGEIRQIEVHLACAQLNGQSFAIASLVEASNIARLQNRAEQLEKNYRTTFELAPIGIAHVGLEGQIMSSNKQFQLLLGYSGVELESLRFHELARQANMNEVLLRSVITSESDTCRLERCFYNKHGESVWLNLIATLCYGSLGTPEHFIVLVENITQRKQFEHELLESEQRFKTIANHVNGVVWMSTPGVGRMLFVNDRYDELWGRPGKRLYDDPMSFFDTVEPEDRAAVLAKLEEHRCGRWDVKYRIRRPSGQTRYIHDIGSPVRDDEGNLLYMVCLAQDITDEQLYRKRLRDTNKKLEVLAKFDPLTMTIRRQYAIPDLKECMALFQRYGTDASLIFVDLDDFKLVNDTHGHDVGDQVLTAFCQAVRENIRETDVLYRYAGDEFLILLRETSQSEALQFLDKLQALPITVRLNTGTSDTTAGNETAKGSETLVRLTFSCGAAALGSCEVRSPDHWVSLADEAMYANKRHRKADAVRHA